VRSLFYINLLLLAALFGGPSHAAEYTKKEIRANRLQPVLLTLGLPKAFSDANPKFVKGMGMVVAYGYSDNDEDTVTEYWLTQTKLQFVAAKRNVVAWSKRHQFLVVDEECYALPRLYCEWQFQLAAGGAIGAILASEPKKMTGSLLELRSFMDKTPEQMKR